NWVPISNRTIPGTNQHYPPKGWIAPGVQKLDGYHALWYGRSREFATDYDRIQRQQCVQQAMIKQLAPATVLTRFQALAEAGEQVVETDIPAEQLSSFVSLAVKAKDQKVERLPIGPPDFGSAADNFVTYPDFALIHKRVQEMSTSAEETGAGSESGPARGEPSGTFTVRTAMVGQEPEITEEYLQQLAEAGDVDTLGALLADNGKCSVP
ncbi:LCP family protein, partial [Arthrobacter deserti]|nr:LCP family protein [Arthrobacter deserti]